MCARSAVARILPSKAGGFTLVEIIVLIVVLGVALVGVLLVFQSTVRASADPQITKQAAAVAEALLDEILLASFDARPGTGARADFDDVADYNGYASAGVRDIQGVPVAGLENYNVAVAVTTPGLNGVAEAMRVTVTVTGPQGVTVSLDGWRLRYAAP